MAGSLLVCQEIKLSPVELSKITGGSSISPGDIFGQQATEEAQQLTAALKAAERRAAAAHEAEIRAKSVTTAIMAGSLLIAATGLYLSWRSRSQPR